MKSILETHLREHPEDAAARVFYAQKLRDWGEGQAALDVVAPLLAKPDAPRRLQDFASELRAAMDVLRRRDPEFGRDDAPLFVAAFRAAGAIPRSLRGAFRDILCRLARVRDGWLR